MSVVTLLPDSAPFSALQRAWLDGFIAGLFGDAEPAAAAEDFPWHDPVLSLDERLALAEGRPATAMLMAAMAQLDCGQCGYLCQSYAEAIAGGGEANLGRCVPGGKPTARKLKELVAGGFVPASVAAAPAPPAAPEIAPGTEFPARLVEALRLNRADSARDTCHIVLAAEGGVYQAGDALGIVAPNAPELVAALVARLGVAAETPVLSPDGAERALADALSSACEIRRVSDQAIEVLASRALDRGESRILQAIAEGYPGAGPENPDLLDLLEAFPSARPPLSELISALDPLQPRLYSIASSPKAAPGEIHLTVAPVRYEMRARTRTGVASTYLCDRVAPGAAVAAFVRPSEGFRPPEPDRAMIMIGPGTGIAPFRAFLQERRATGATGRNWLFFGNPHRATDFFYEKELAEFRRDGLLTRLDTAFSRDQEHKIYVQHRLLEHAAELWAWLQDGAAIYVCGDAARMARDVDRGLAYILAKEGRMDAAAAKSYLAGLTRDGRYLRDIY